MVSFSHPSMPSLTCFRGSTARLAVSRCLVLSVFVTLSCMGAKRSRIVPPQAEPPVSVRGERVSVNVGGLGIGLEILDATDRTRFLEKRQAAMGTDPFADDPRGRYRFVTFRLDLVNNGEEDVNVHPSNLLAYADATPHYPMEYTAFYEHFVSKLRLDQRVLEELEGAVIMANIEVPPGGRASALLVYRGLPERFKRFKILCSSILVGAESRTFVVPFGVIQEKIPKSEQL
jgi:hypothetical protein